MYLLFNRVHILSTVLLLCILAASLSTPILVTGEGKPVVLATTSVLSSIVRDLAGDRVVVEVIASPSICPAHYDIKPSDVEKVREANLILRHGIEPWIEDLVKASGSNAPIITVKGPWNTPGFLREKYIAVANALNEYLGINVSMDLERCLRVINETSKWLKSFAEENGFTGTPVVAMEWQKDFLSFLGFNIVASYGPPEKVTPKQYEEIIMNATEKNALLIVDNLQSGTELGRKIASEINGVEVALTNFPGTAPGLDNMTEVMKYNVQLLAQALYFARLKNTSISIGSLYEEIISAQQEATLWKYAFLFSIIVNVVLAIGVASLVLKLKRR